MLNKKALAASVSAPPAEYVEDVFSTYLYTGTNANQTITNGIDLTGNGGLVWTKSRSHAYSNYLVDTERGNTNFIISNSTDAETSTSDISSFNSNGYSLRSDVNGGWNNNGVNFCSWTFRKAEKFFDVVTYTGNGVARNISHNLGSVPGMIIIKLLNQSSDWVVYHRGMPNTDYLYLNATNGSSEVPDYWNDTTPTSTTFRVNTNSAVNSDGQPYVAYLFAHNAGGFGDAGTDNIISCGSFTTNGSGNATIDLGYEPQYLMFKRSDSTANWIVADTMRGWSMSTDAMLRANLSNAESNTELGNPTATGFYVEAAASATYIYMAIRRPMKTPTSGTEVFHAYNGVPSNGTLVNSGITSDLRWARSTANAGNFYVTDRLRGFASNSGDNYVRLQTNTTNAEVSERDIFYNDWNTSYRWGYNIADGSNCFAHSFSRAPGFFDIVCYTGTGSATTVTHNLGVAPELMIVKRRSTSGTSWFTYSTATGNTNALLLDTTDAAFSATAWNNTTPTSSVFSLGTSVGVNGSGSTYVAYLFATLAGVSKVGSYTGNGSSQTINCGFTAGARFVMVKATSTSGDWTVFDTARGINSGNDPWLILNATYAEGGTAYDHIDPDSSGFVIVENGNTTLNTSGVNYIYLAIA